MAAGVRRIEAKTAGEARRYLNAKADHLRDVASAAQRLPKTTRRNVLPRLIEDRRKLERDLSDARKKLAMGGTE